ncbi:hypothetical protein DH2020_044589 [Rehmannia glutinosa]|uniref:Uncharacterized protein n=1 Tax=Rehmannia glutinosa TaxID=99300 RepID=A0ABR0UH77_REHGL
MEGKRRCTVCTVRDRGKEKERGRASGKKKVLGSPPKAAGIKRGLFDEEDYVDDSPEKKKKKRHCADGEIQVADDVDVEGAKDMDITEMAGIATQPRQVP